MAHPFFDGVDWSRLRTRVPPFIPKVFPHASPFLYLFTNLSSYQLSDEADTSYFPAARSDTFGELPAVETDDFDELESSASFASVPRLPLPSSPGSPRDSPFPTASIHRVYSHGNYEQETSRGDDSYLHSPSIHHPHVGKREDNEHMLSCHSLLEDDGPASDDPPPHVLLPHPDGHFLSRSHFFLPSTPSLPFSMRGNAPMETVNSLYTLHNYNALAHHSLTTAESTYTVNTYNSVQSVPSVPSMGSAMYSVPSSFSVTSDHNQTSPSSPSDSPSTLTPNSLTPVASFTLTPSPPAELPGPSQTLATNSPHTLSPSASPRRTSPLRSTSTSPRRSSPLRSNSPSPRRTSPPRGSSPLRSNSPSPRDTLAPSPRTAQTSTSPRQPSPNTSPTPAPHNSHRPTSPTPPVLHTMPTIPAISNIPTSTDSARSLFTPNSTSSNPSSPSLSAIRSPHARPRNNQINNEINLHQVYSNARTASSTDPTTTPTSSIFTPPPIRKQKNTSLSALDPPRSIAPTTNSLPNVYAPSHPLSSSLTSSTTSTSLPPSRLSTPPQPPHDHSSSSPSLSSSPASYSLGALLTHKAHGTPTSISAGQARKIQISGFDFVRSGGQ
jgi:hypothetical protein